MLPGAMWRTTGGTAGEAAARLRFRFCIRKTCYWGVLAEGFWCGVECCGDLGRGGLLWQVVGFFGWLGDGEAKQRTTEIPPWYLELFCTP